MKKFVKLYLNLNISQKYTDFSIIIISSIIYYILFIFGQRRLGLLISNFIRLFILGFLKYIKGTELKEYLISFKPYISDNFDKKKIIESIDIPKVNKDEPMIKKFFELNPQDLKLINLDNTKNTENLVKEIVSITKENVLTNNTETVVETIKEVSFLSLHSNFIIGSLVALGLGIVTYYIVKQIEVLIFQKDYIIASIVKIDILKEHGFLDEDPVRLKKFSNILQENAGNKYYRNIDEFIDFLNNLMLLLLEQGKIVDVLILKYFLLKIQEPALLKILMQDDTNILRTLKDSFFPDEDDDPDIGTGNFLEEFWKSGDYLE